MREVYLWIFIVINFLCIYIKAEVALIRILLLECCKIIIIIIIIIIIVVVVIVVVVVLYERVPLEKDSFEMYLTRLS